MRKVLKDKLQKLPYLASGGAPYSETSRKIIRLVLHGCTNRPFFHIVVQEAKAHHNDPVIEQLGTYDPMPNQFNEKLVALNCDRIIYWLGNKADFTDRVAELFGKAGLFPVHHRTYLAAWRQKRKLLQELEELKITAAKISQT